MKLKRLSVEELCALPIEAFHLQIVNNHDDKYHGILETACHERIRRIPKATNVYPSEVPRDFASSPAALVGKRNGPSYLAE